MWEKAIMFSESAKICAYASFQKGNDHSQRWKSSGIIDLAEKHSSKLEFFHVPKTELCFLGEEF